MRLELGALKIELEEGDDVEAFFRSLFRHFNNMELSEMLGVSPKTVTRWKRDGRLPGGPGKGLTMLELLGAVKEGAVAGPAGKPRKGRTTSTRETIRTGVGGGETTGEGPPSRPNPPESA
ncbi:MAG: hypothetical protein V3S64_05085 [bacterium]